MEHWWNDSDNGNENTQTETSSSVTSQLQESYMDRDGIESGSPQ
jgi:hypothetical protein